MQKPLAVILGAGPVGTSVGTLFRERDFEVRFVTRSGQQRGLPGEVRAADIRDGESLTAATQGAQVIVHAAGVPYQDWFRDFPLMQTAVLRAAEATGAVAVFAENLYSYSPGSTPLTEASPEKPTTRKGTLRLELSRMWQEAHASGRVRAVAVRASDYFGPGATLSPNSHFGQRFFPPLEAGKPVAFLGNPDARHSFTYLKDYARALVDVALDPGAWGRAWLAPCLGPTSARQVAEAFGREAGVPVKVGKLPRFLVQLLGLVNPVVREVTEMLYQFEGDFTVDASAFETRFGWKATSLEAAVGETWAAHRATRG